MRKKAKGSLPSRQSTVGSSIDTQAAALIERARRRAEDRYGPDPSNEVILAIADEILDGGADSEEDESTPGAAADNQPKRMRADLTECATCDQTDPAFFSRRMLHRRGRHGERVRRCLDCVAVSERTERAEAAQSKCTAPGDTDPTAKARPDPAQEVVECAGCAEALRGTEFSRNQLQKARGGKPARCVRCVGA